MLDNVPIRPLGAVIKVENISLILDGMGTFMTMNPSPGRAAEREESGGKPSVLNCISVLSLTAYSELPDHLQYITWKAIPAYLWAPR